ncbi:PREDICTED: chromatin assembly factor 1 subunit A-B [Vollenhovia emeryi]|uniref:chromatin assembly factor 1 subunit A-B n=1 Tax=Vollenhovia emeryi TaxID=411798 RepID=UPI0005F5727E|nr:PREDICTED: chromatin assembly factor 1 subunit A-B [Vollenhovia emeryi]
MKSMDVSTDDVDCLVDAVTPAKKKKMRQAQLPFQMLSSSKSPSSADNVLNKKKRKIISPVVGAKNSKVVKLAAKENLVRDEKKEDADEIKRDSNDDTAEILTSDDEKKEQGDTQKSREDDGTAKSGGLGKDKKLDKSQQKLGALTKFLKRTDRVVEEVDISGGDNLSELKDKKDCQNTPAHKGESKIRLNESSDTSLDQSELQDTSRLSETDDCLTGKSVELSLQESDCDITMLSSDNETSSELDKSVTSKETTDKSATSVTPKTNKEAKSKIKTLTPKQLEKRREIARRKEEKLKLKMEKEKKREEEKANRRRERAEKQREKEEREKMEKEQKNKEKKLKELRKQMENEQKQKEKEAREEERKKREEEKRRKEEERLEVERKKQKAASNFASFFVSKKQEAKSADEESVVEVKNFMPFEIKADMRVAPVCRRKLNDHDKLLLDNKRNADADVDGTELYLEDIRRRRILTRTSSKTWPLEAKDDIAKDDDIVLLDEDNDGSSNIITGTHNLEKHRPKLLQFKENRRPPYWGTWRKRSSVLNSRRPFTKDEKWFDYEVDSDDEWEEEEPGESLKGSDDEKDEENPEDNEYDVDNEFMVPHGYLSDEEAQADEEEMEDMSPQTQKMKLKILGERFEAERNAKTYKLKPKIVGCIWQGPDNSFPAFISPKIKEFLLARQAWVNSIPIVFPSESPEEDTSANAECKTSIHQQSVRGAKKTKFPDEALPDLILLVHGNRHGRHGLMKEFMTFWSKKGGGHLSKVSILSKINEIADRIACPEEGPMHLKSCWYVSEDIRKQHLPGVELPLPNRWKYILTLDRKKDTENIVADKIEKGEGKEKEKEKKYVSLITQFTKKITQEELKKQLAKSDQEEAKKQSTATPDQNEMKKQSTSKSDQEEIQKQSAAKPDQEETKKESSSKSDQISALPKLPPLQRPPKRVTLISVGRGEQFPESSRQNMLAKFIGLNKQKEERSEKMVDSDEIKLVKGNDTNETDKKSKSKS